MVTIYDLLEVDEKASKEEIEKAYQKLILEYGQDPKLTPKENADNELILNKVKIAYEILMSDEKRAKYDKDLSKKRAEELIKNVAVSEVKEEIKEEPKVQEEDTSNQYNDDEYDDSEDDDEVSYNQVEEQEVTLSKEEQKRVQKAAQNEFKANLRKAQKAEEEYNKAYNEAYNNYMKKMGYQVKEGSIFKRIMNVIILIVVIAIVCFIAWLIPPVRNSLIDLYNENIIIKALVDIVGMIFKAIFSIFKK